MDGDDGDDGADGTQRTVIHTTNADNMHTGHLHDICLNLRETMSKVCNLTLASVNIKSVAAGVDPLPLNSQAAARQNELTQKMT